MPERYQEIFDQRGGRYDDAMAAWPEVRREEFAFVLDLVGVGAGDVVVDVPSGGGYLADHLPAGVRLVPVETSAVFAERCRARGLEPVVGGLDGAELAAGSADVVVSVAGMHHEPDHGGALAAWRRLLRPGGRLVAADVARGSAQAAFLDGFVGDHLTAGHRGTYFGAEVGGLATAAGLVEVAVVDGSYHWWADDPGQLARFCATLFGLDAVSDDEVLAALAAGPGLDHAADGRVGLRWGLRALVARAPGAA